MTNHTTATANADSAEIFAFPIARTESGRFIASEYQRRPAKGRYNKAAYADGVIKARIERLQNLGIAPDRIDDEVAELEELFRRLGGNRDTARATA